MKKLLLTLSFFITSCASFQISTLNYDPIYGPDNNEIKVDVLTTDWDVFRKFEIDSDFRYDYAWFASNQPYSWYLSNRHFNRLSLYSPFTTWDFYMNRHLFWNDWAFNFNYSYNYHWGRIFPRWRSWNNPYWGRWNSIYAYNFNYRPYYDQFKIYNNNRRSRNISYSATPRGSREIRYNQPRRVLTPTNIKNNNVDNVIETLRRNGINVRYNEGRNNYTPYNNRTRINSNTAGSTITIPRNNSSIRNHSTRNVTSNRNSSSVRTSSSSSSRGSSNTSGGSRGCAKC